MRRAPATDKAVGAYPVALSSGALRARLGRWFNWTNLISMPVVLVVAFMVTLPTVWLVVISFRPSTNVAGFTLRWYERLFTDPALLQRGLNTLLLAAGTMFFCLLIGLPVAWCLARTDMPFARQLNALAILPFVTPPLLGALAWSNLLAPRTGLVNILLRQWLGIEGNLGPINIYGVWGVAFVMGLYYSPYVINFVAGALSSMDSTMEEAAFAAGANGWTVARKITLPLVLPAIASSALLAFVFSAGQFTIPALLGVPGGMYVYSTTIHQQAKLWPPNLPLATALGMVLVVVAVALTWLRNRLTSRGSFVTVTGRGFRPRVIRLGPFRWVALAFCLVYMLLAAVMPILSLVYGSLLSFWRPTFSPSDFTLANYVALFETPMTWNAMKNSLILSVGGATLTMALAVVAAFITVRRKDPLAQGLGYFAMLPTAVPSVVLGVALLIAYLRPPLVLYGGLGILLVGYMTHFFPVGLNAAASSLVQVHRELEESARVFGANFLTMLRRITVPLIKPGVVAGWVTLVVIFMRELAISVFVYSPGNEVLAVQLYELWNDGRVTRASALAVLVILQTAIILGLLRFFGARVGSEWKGAGQG